ncbi:hypothetical protein Tco_0670944 [Tanacetum coccineum]
MSVYERCCHTWRPDHLFIGTVYHDLYLGGKALAERENVGFNLARPLPYAKDSITTQTYELLQEEFKDFLSLYPVPSEYHVILRKSNQTFFDSPPGYVGLYTHSFSLSNLRLSLTEFFCELMVVSPLSTSSEGSLICVELVGTNGFFYVQDSIIPAKYPQLLFEQNKLDLKSFNNKLPPNIEENPIFQHLSRYPTSVHVFPDPIHFLAGLKPSWEHVNTEPLKANEEPSIQPVKVTTDYRGNLKPELFVVHLGSVAAWINDRKCKTKGGPQGPLLRGILLLDLELLDLHDRCYARQAVVDNDMNRRCDVMRSRERAKDEECEGMQVKNEEGKRRGVDYEMSKILGFYKECLELGPEYVTGLDDEGEVTLYLRRRSLEILRKFHWMILGERFNQLSHVSSPLLSKPGEY